MAENKKLFLQAWSRQGARGTCETKERSYVKANSLPIILSANMEVCISSCQSRNTSWVEVSVQAGREVHGVIHRVNGSECVQRMRSHVWNVWEVGNAWCKWKRMAANQLWESEQLGQRQINRLIGGINMPAQHIFNPEVKMLLIFIKKGFQRDQCQEFLSSQTAFPGNIEIYSQHIYIV